MVFCNLVDPFPPIISPFLVYRKSVDSQFDGRFFFDPFPHCLINLFEIPVDINDIKKNKIKLLYFILKIFGGKPSQENRGIDICKVKMVFISNFFLSTIPFLTDLVCTYFKHILVD